MSINGKEREMKRKQPRTRWLLAICVALALGALVLAGCGGSSGASSGSTAETSTTASAAGTEGGANESGASESGAERSGSEAAKGGPGAMEISTEARACLKEKGVELPEFKNGEGGPPSGGETPEGMPEGGEAPGGEAGQMPGGGEPPQGGEGGPPAGGFGGEGSEEMTKAFEECGVEMPGFKGGPGRGSGAPNTNSTAFRRQVKEYVACVRENGYELAEPNFSGEGPVFAQEESESAAFKKASAQCQSLLGAPQASSSETET
jgi:hypothetical protein